MLRRAQILYIISWIACFYVGPAAYAQYPRAVDSLHAEISTTPNDRLTGVFDPLYAELQKMPFKTALPIALRTLEIANREGSTLSRILAYRNIAMLHNDNGNKAEALRFLQDAVTVARTDRQEVHGLAVALFDLGQFLSNQGLFSEGLTNIFEAAKIFDRLDERRYIILCHYEACVINYKAKNYQISIEEGNRVISEYYRLDPKSLTNKDSFQMMTTYNTVALGNSILKQYDLSLVNFDRAELMARRMKNIFWEGLVNGNKALVYRSTGKTDLALQSLLADKRISERFKVWNSAAVASISVSEIYMGKKEYSKSKLYLDSAHRLLRAETDIYMYRRVQSAYYNAMGKLRLAQGDYRGAYEAMARHVELRDSLNQEQEALNIAKVKANYDLDRKQSEIEELTRNNEIQQERIRSQRTLFVATLIGLILLVILVITLVYNYRRQRNISRVIRNQRDEIEEKNMELEAQSAQLQENNQFIQSLNLQLEQKVTERTRELEVANRELDTFLYRSSHDIRRPITTLLGLDLVARHVIQDEQANMLFDKVVETARHMDNMLFKMQMIYELNKPMPEPVRIHFNDFLQTVIEGFLPDFSRYTMHHHVHVRDEVVLYSNQSLLQIIFKNLIENAVLFRKQQPDTVPFVDIVCRRINEEQIEIVVADNGMGVEEKYQSQIFDLYFRASQASKGNGLGLYLVRKAVQKLHGTITMMSDYGVGTTFTIVLPIRL